MKSVSIGLSLILAVSAGTIWQQQASAQRKTNPDAFYKAPTSLHGKTVLVPVGSTFEGRIDKTIGSSVSHAGDQFHIVMAAPVLANGVDVIIPSGSQILGEVVEAISHDEQEHHKGQPKTKGKLRIQITGLRTPDGQTYPMVASITGETVMMGKRVMRNDSMGGGVGYMGSTAGFEAVGPGMKDAWRRNMRGPSVVSREQMKRDPIY